MNDRQPAAKRRPITAKDNDPDQCSVSSHGRSRLASGIMLRQYDHGLRRLIQLHCASSENIKCVSRIVSRLNSTRNNIHISNACRQDRFRPSTPSCAASDGGPTSAYYRLHSSPQIARLFGSGRAPASPPTFRQSDCASSALSKICAATPRFSKAPPSLMRGKPEVV
jgi:hypothetical protein